MVDGSLCIASTLFMPTLPFHEVPLPRLRRSADGKEWILAALRGPINDDFGLTDAEWAELLPSGTQRRFDNRLCWSKIYLERVGLLSRVHRVVFTISGALRKVLTESPSPIDLDYLDRRDSFCINRESCSSREGVGEAAGPMPAVEPLGWSLSKPTRPSATIPLACSSRSLLSVVLPSSTRSSSTAQPLALTAAGAIRPIHALPQQQSSLLAGAPGCSLEVALPRAC